MKRLIYLTLILSALFTTRLNAQELKNTSAFYITITNSLTAINSFDEVNEAKLDRETAIAQVEKNLTVIDSNYQLLKKEYSNDEDFEEYENWVLAMQKSLPMLIDNDPMYVLAATLIRMSIYEFVNSKY